MVFMPHWPIPYGKRPIDLGLERIKELLARLGNPHKKLPPVVHVAGTNGKGSTIAFLKSILEAAGYRVHRYISPHLTQFNERICLAGNNISDEYLYEICEETRLAASDLQTTFFEGTTAAAFLAFARTPADIVLLETGMGGRLDATNVIDKPAATVITPIGFDHTEYLGETLAQIAAEKAGIIKAGVPCIISWQHDEAYKTLESRCHQLQAPIFAHAKQWDFRHHSKDTFLWSDGDKTFEFPLPALQGAHQMINASAAIACLQWLPAEFQFKLEDIANGLIKAKWPARLERIETGVLARKLPPGWELWLDGAHNVQAAEIMASIVDSWDDKPLILINGRTAERDIAGFLKYFQGKASHVIGVTVQSEPRAEKGELISQVAHELGFTTASFDFIDDAVQHAISLGYDQARILACGSLYLAGDILLANKA
jgi:dihydrofolate synthase/folylpolyglutamate synthase